MKSETPRTDELINELNKLKSNTLAYPCETQLKELCRDLERELNAANNSIKLMRGEIAHLNETAFCNKLTHGRDA